MSPLLISIIGLCFFFVVFFIAQCAAAQHLTSDESTRLRLSDSYVNEVNKDVPAAPKPIMVSTGSLERSSQGSNCLFVFCFVN